MRTSGLFFLTLGMLLVGCRHNEIVKKHPWQSWGNTETFLVSAKPEAFWALDHSYVKLKPECWAQLAQLLETEEAIPVSEAWVKEFAVGELPPGDEPWYLVRGLSYGEWCGFSIYFFPESDILYVYTATMTGELFPNVAPTVKARPVAVRLSSAPRRVLCAAQCGGSATTGMHYLRDSEELPQIQWSSAR